MRHYDRMPGRASPWHSPSRSLERIMRSRWRSGLIACLVVPVVAIVSVPLRAAAQQNRRRGRAEALPGSLCRRRLFRRACRGTENRGCGQARRHQQFRLRLGAERPGPRPPGAGPLQRGGRDVQAGARHAAEEFPPGDARLAQPLANLATVYLLQANSGEAEKLYKQALDISTKAQGGPIRTSPCSSAISATSTRPRRAMTKPRHSTSARSTWRRRPAARRACWWR